MAAARPLPHEREREIVDATRRLFDEQGLQDAPIERIARAVGINKALIYRHFSSKEELFVATVTRYLEDLGAELAGLDLDDAAPPEALRAVMERYIDFIHRHPAFLDCGLSLMRRPFPELAERVSGSVLFRVGDAMGTLLGRLASVLEAGTARGDFAVEDPHLVANHLYTQALGTMHLARFGVGVRRGGHGFPETFAIDAEAVRAACVEDAIAHASRRT